MQPATIHDAPPALGHRQRQALISLLVDDDPAIYQMVRRKLISYGSVATDWLRPHTLSDEPMMRRRVREIVRHIARQQSDERLLNFCLNHGEELDLEEATGLLAQTHYPEANLDAYQALYDCWAADLREKLNPAGTVEQTVEALNQFLFGELGFAANDQYPYQPESCYLNCVVDQRKGNPISLCTIYLFMARRLQLPITGIGLPSHFVCRYQSATQEIYIDVFRQGKLLRKADCIKYLHNSNHGLHEGYLTPVSNRRMLLRMCANLHQTYAHLELTEEAGRVQRYLVALTK